MTIGTLIDRLISGALTATATTAQRIADRLLPPPDIQPGLDTATNNLDRIEEQQEVVEAQQLWECCNDICYRCWDDDE